MDRDSSDDDDNGEVNTPNIRARSSRRMTQMRLMHIHSIIQLMVVMQVHGPGPSGVQARGSADSGDGGIPMGSIYLVRPAYKTQAVQEMNLTQ